MQEEGKDREGGEAQADGERPVAEFPLEVERDERDERAKDEVQAEHRGVSRGRRGIPRIPQETSPWQRLRGRLRGLADREGNHESDDEPGGEDIEQGGVSEPSNDGSRDPEPEDDREGERHPV